MPQVSIILPVYNCERYVEEAVESIFRQTFRDFELIVVNDGSSDGTERRLQKYLGRMTYLRQEHRGPGAARNRGLQIACGPLIAFHDADDIWFPRKLERQVEFAQAHPEYGIVATDAMWFDERGIVRRSKKSMYPISSGYVMDKLLFHNWIAVPAVLVRRECFDKVGTFDEEPGRRGTDWTMWVRIAAYFPVHFMDEILIAIRVYQSSFSRRDPEARFESYFHNLEKLANTVPPLAARPELVREAAFRVCLRHAVENLCDIEPERARAKLRRALGLKRRSLRAWALLVAAHTPRWGLRGLKTTARLCRRFLVSASLGALGEQRNANS